jgi:transcriptional regulator with XRE-family HTH domain
VNKIGNKIRIIRDQKGLSQENLAANLGITQSSYARLEKKDDRISINRLFKIAEILGVEVSNLLVDDQISAFDQTKIIKHQIFNPSTLIAEKDHIQSLKEEIGYLKEIIEKLLERKI